MEPLLELNNISKTFSLGKKRKLRALSKINLEVYPKEALGIVGESGCGKSTLARVIMGIYDQTLGEVKYCGKTVNLKSHRSRLEYAKKVQMIFQDTYSSLNPRMTVEAIISENMEIQGCSDTKINQNKVYELLKMVGLPSEAAYRYPHEFSGGQRQRIGIARALALQPELIICDEPISALDMSIQSQIMNLLIDLKESLHLTYIFIAHDLNMVRYISDRIAVMYGGCLIELATADELCSSPLHPYTSLLMNAASALTLNNSKLSAQSIDVPDMVPNLSDGCPFFSRCIYSIKKCEGCSPVLKQIKNNHFVACHMDF